VKYKAIIEKTRIDYDGKYFLILPNIAAGKKFRYTVYQLPTSDGGRVKILGRELDLKTARWVVKNHSK